MITSNDLQAAIAELEGARRPNANTCLKLAALYTIREHMQTQKNQETEEKPTYSLASSPHTFYTSNTDFGQIVQDKDAYDVLLVFDELLTTLQGMIPRLYDGVLAKLESI